MERRESRNVAQFKLSPEAPTAGPFKGYERLDWINSRASRKETKSFANLMHHFSAYNLHQAFRGLDGSKASGTDQMTKQKYAEALHENIQTLSDKIQRGGWRPKPTRQVMIPKANGGWRPLAVGCLEDKIVQTLTAKILEAIFEPEFYSFSYGFRAGKSQHQAIAKVYASIANRAKANCVVEMDIEKFFDNIDHDKLIQLIETKISDTSFLRHLRRQLRNSTLTQDGNLLKNETGAPQGNPVSPVLANIYLHYVLDEWFFQKWVDHGEMVRFADDAVFIFTQESHATEFRKQLEARLLNEGNIRLNTEKSHLVRFHSHTKEGNISFLGFTFYWGKKYCGPNLLRVKTASKTLNRCMQSFTQWIRNERNRVRLKELWQQAATKLRGHYQYFGVSTNRGKLYHYYNACIHALFKWLNRRSQKKSFNWERFSRRLTFEPLPLPTLSEALVNITNGLGLESKHKPRSRMRKLRTYGSKRSSGRQSPLFT
jgi:group II intron reverse transcriptase/maturase